MTDLESAAGYAVIIQDGILEIMSAVMRPTRGTPAERLDEIGVKATALLGHTDALREALRP